MRKHFLVFIVMLATLSIQAQSESRPIAFALDGINHHLIAIDDAGGQRIIELPIPENAFLGGSMMTVSPDAQYAALCWGLSSDTGNSYHVSVLELDSNTVLLEVDYGKIQMCDATTFNIDSTQLAVSTVIAAPVYDQSDAAEWALEIYDLDSGSVVAELAARDEIAAAFAELGDDVPILADVKIFDGDQVTFAALPFVGMGGISDVPAFSWNLSDDSLTATDYIGKVSGDGLLAASEFVFPALNEDYDAAMPDGPLPLANEVRYFDGQDESVIYRNTDWVVVQTRFIQNGERLAILLLENARTDGLLSQQRSEILSRDGTVSELPQLYANFAQIGNYSDGAVVLWAESPNEGTPVTHLSTIAEDNEVQTIWTYQAPTNPQGFTFLELVWSQPLPEDSNHNPFPTVES